MDADGGWGRGTGVLVSVGEVLGQAMWTRCVQCMQCMRERTWPALFSFARSERASAAARTASEPGLPLSISANPRMPPAGADVHVDARPAYTHRSNQTAETTHTNQGGEGRCYSSAGELLASDETSRQAEHIAPA